MNAESKSSLVGRRTEQNRHFKDRPEGIARAVREEGSDSAPEAQFSNTDNAEQTESMKFVRDSESDYFIEDDPKGDGAVPIENLYASAGIDDLRREGDASVEALGQVEPLTSPDIGTPDIGTDDRIREIIFDAIMNEIGDEPELEIAVEGDQVTLHGSVSSVKARTVAELTARHVSGVGIVINELEVDRPRTY
ncbi:MAG: BON domain-containing protein [Deltaproteobacteria bacterium]|nr:BON domain-containing protein [Deltaproteobacteria bacterium]